MNAIDFIQTKQISWARRNNIKLVGSQLTKGMKLYTQKLEDNLFEPISKEVTIAFESGDGRELKKIGNTLPKMHALHSSSALGVNVFQYWKTKNKVSDIAYACSLCLPVNKNSIDIKFEEKYIISTKFAHPPNIDVVIINSKESDIKVFAIECKFTEAYTSRQHDGLKPVYLSKIPEQWNDLPNLFNLANKVSPMDNTFQFLHASQLIKHILGLKKCFKNKNSFRLLYLWYDVYGFAGTQHRKEIAEFKEIARKDKILFHSLSYQELLIRLQKQFYNGNEEYLHYLTDRYL